MLLAYLAAAVMVAVAGFRLGAGDGVGAAATAVAGCPPALLAAVALSRRPRPAGSVAVRAVHLLAGTDRDDLLRVAAALHSAASDTAAPDTAAPDIAAGPQPHAAGRALAAAAAGPLPGVSDLDGTVSGGLRGVVSDLRGAADGPVIVAHAVLVGPAGWAAAHGVDEPAGLPADGLVVAWDGIARGAVEIGPEPGRPPAGTRAVAVVGALTAVAGGLVAPLLPAAVLAAWPVLALLAAALVAAVPAAVPHTTR